MKVSSHFKHIVKRLHMIIINAPYSIFMNKIQRILEKREQNIRIRVQQLNRDFSITELFSCNF